jgi:NitT/TauT family transport system substrate-binding protein
MRASRYIQAWSLVLVAGLVLACTPAQSGQPAPSGAKPTAAAGAAAPKAGELKKVRVGFSGVGSTQSAPSFLAKEKGWYAKHGVDAELTEYQSGSATQEALAGGNADIINYFPPGIAAAVQKGIKEKIIASDMTRPAAWYLMVAPNSPITSVEQLAGKKIGVTAKGTTTDYFALWVADKHGIKVDNVPIGFTALLTGVTSGNVDASIVPPPLSFRALANNEAKPIFDYAKDMPPSLPAVFAASDGLIQQSPEAVTGYLKGHFEGIRYMKQNPEEAIDFVAKHTKQDRAVAEADYKATIMSLSDDGHIQAEWLDNSLALAKLGGVTDLPAKDQMFTTQFTPVKLD